MEFRAWDKLNEGFHFSNGYKNLSSFFLEIDKLHEAGNGITLGLYTGLQDKHDRPIFVGDILATGSLVLGPVELVDGAFNIISDTSNQGRDIINQERCDRLVILGNKYQDQKLLT